MTEADQVLTASFSWTDDPVDIDEIDGLRDAIENVASDPDGGNVLVRCEDRVADYDVYWNTKTETVRFAAVVPGASYEVPQEAIEGVPA